MVLRSGTRAAPEDSTVEEVRDFVGRATAAAGAMAHDDSDRLSGALRDAAREVVEQADALIALAAEETGLSEQWLNAEVHRTATQLDQHAAVRDALLAHEEVEAGFIRRARPLGPVAVFAASNFPFAFSVAGTDVSSALAAGCPVVAKVHPGHPATSVATASLLARALRDRGVDPGAYQLVHGVEAGARLVSEAGIRAVAFTGSTRGGRALFDLAQSRPDPIPFYGELGSLNPVVVTPDAIAGDPDAFASGFIDSMTTNSGQLCTKPGVVFAPAGSDFSRRALAALSAADARGPLLTPGIEQALHGALLRAVRAARQRYETPAGDLLEVDAADFLAHPDLREEIFGPAAVIVSYQSVGELEECLRVLDPALVGAVQAGSDDDPVARRAVAALADRVGRLVWNGWTTGVAVNQVMHHGGTWPASTSPLHTSVGARAVDRFRVPIVYQGVPRAIVPRR